MNAEANARNYILNLTTQDDTIRLAAIFVKLAQAGMTILLHGQVGAGKTFFARSVIQTLQDAHGQREDVPSPTFTLIQTYEAGGLEIWHADLYRLTSPEELVELGLDAAFSNALCLIEWPDRLGSLRPTNAIDLTLEPCEGEEQRLCMLSSESLQMTRIILDIKRRFDHEK